MYTHFAIISDFHTIVPVHFLLGEYIFFHSIHLLTIRFDELIIGICLWFMFGNERFGYFGNRRRIYRSDLDANKNAFGAIVRCAFINL